MAATGHGLYISRDGGAIWQPLGKGLPFNSQISGLLTHPARPQQILALSDNAMLRGIQPPLLFRSADAGGHWDAAVASMPDVPATAWALDPQDPNTLFVASWNQILRSTDAGLTWQSAPLDSSARKAVVTRLPMGRWCIWAVGPPCAAPIAAKPGA